ncbi:MAG: single-stranded-DNA-specific exonuclease RecJ [Patescibacteria group bacterium]|jgi:single-stranded-DNA-specific exonuclease
MKFAWKIQSEEEKPIRDLLLANRGILPEETERFFHLNWDEHLESCWNFREMAGAVERLFFALEHEEKIVIHGDYDADGVSGSALLFESIRDIAIALHRPLHLAVYLPDREADGYGVAMHTVERFAAEKIKLLITVDCGIAVPTEIARAKELGIDTIVCDHHQLALELPKAILLHPLVPGEGVANRWLCGTGVVFKFACALFDEARKRGLAIIPGKEKWLLDFVAIATVTDMVPLLGENRLLEHFGLRVLKKTRRPGLSKIFERARIERESIDAHTIGFQIGPRLNAAGRLASAQIAFETLTAKTLEEADPLSEQLEQLNQKRQRLTDGMFVQAETMIQEVEDAPVHVLWHADWHPGIVGLLAGKLVAKTGRPAFAFARSGGHFVGSGRSTLGINLVELMQSAPHFFVKFGGHPEACGLTIAREETIRDFSEHAKSFVKKFIPSAKEKPELRIDAVIPLSMITEDLTKMIEAMAPFGQKNPEPTFLSRSVTILDARTVGKTQAHLRVTVSQGSRSRFEVIGFGFGNEIRLLSIGKKVDLVYEIHHHEWQGRRTIQLRLLDFEPND